MSVSFVRLMSGIRAEVGMRLFYICDCAGFAQWRKIS